MRNKPKACAFGTEQGDFGRFWPSTAWPSTLLIKEKRGKSSADERGLGSPRSLRRLLTHLS